MTIAVAQAAPVHEGQPIQEVAVAIGRRLQLLEVRGELRDVVRVDLHELRQLLGVVLMVRE